MAKKPALTVVGEPPSNPGSPHRKLGLSGGALWRTIMNDYEIVNSGGREMLSLACQRL